MAEHLLVIGAQRAGSTLLYELLDAHADVSMARPVRPEPRWFLNHPEGDAAAYRRELFGAAGPVRYLGEKSTTYLERGDVAARVRAVLGDAWIVATLRDPVERAISNYRFSVDHGVETLPIDEALTPEAEARPWDDSAMSTSPYHYLRRGRYAELLAPWRAAFGAARLVLVDFDDLVAGRAWATLAARLGLRGAADGPAAPVNRSHAVVPDDLAAVRSRLREIYREPNASLRADFGVDTSRWQ